MAYALNTNYHFVSHAGSGSCLNVYGNDTVSHNRNVTLWRWDDSKAQNWQVRADGNYLRIVTSILTTYALNAWRGETPYNCDIYPYSGNEKDARIVMINAGTSSDSDLYKIKLLNYNMYLTAPSSTDNGGSVKWASELSSGTRQIWKVTTVKPVVPPPSIRMSGHLVSYAGVGPCLNVYGNETIDNNRNVCVWSWDYSAAQTWRIGSTNTGRNKIFSSLGYPTYALNIYRDGTNNCDVFPHTNNDTDSTIEYILVTGSVDLYRIKMSAYNLYLTAMGRYDGANVRWASQTSGSEQVWKLTNVKPPVTNPDPDPGEPIDNADSTLVDVVVPAHTDNFRNGRNGNAVSEITLHHMDSTTMTVESCGEGWQKPGVKVSSHYGVRDNRVGQYVSEANASYCNGGDGLSNDRAVTIEIGDSPASGGYNYPINAATYETVIKLVADIAKRNGLGKLSLVTDVTGKTPSDLVNATKYTGTTPPPGNLSWHCFYRATQCPGDYLLSHLQDIADKANKINGY